MKEIPKALWDNLAWYLVNEIRAGVMDGITYSFMVKDTKDMETYRKCMEIKNEVRRQGFDEGEIFRIFQVSNGWIADMDLSLAKRISYILTQEAIKESNIDKKRLNDLIHNGPDRRRKEDLGGLGKFIKKEYESGKDATDVALYSTNKVPHIIITGKGPKGEDLCLKFQAFALKHTDISALNEHILIPKCGLRVRKITPCEILSSRTGVRFTLDIEKM